MRENAASGWVEIMRFTPFLAKNGDGIGSAKEKAKTGLTVGASSIKFAHCFTQNTKTKTEKSYETHT
jgi:hypothetical protein